MFWFLRGQFSAHFMAPREQFSLNALNGKRTVMRVHFCFQGGSLTSKFWLQRWQFTLLFKAPKTAVKLQCFGSKEGS